MRKLFLLGLAFVVLLLVVQIVTLGRQNMELRNTLSSAEREANDYQNKLRQELSVKPTGVPGWQKLKPLYRDNLQDDAVLDELECQSLDKVQQYFHEESSYQISVEEGEVIDGYCYNKEKGELVYWSSYDIDSPLDEWSKLKWVDVVEEVEREAFLSFREVECEHRVKWTEDGWIYFSCVAEATGLKGNFSNAEFTKVYYTGNFDLYDVENCSDSGSEFHSVAGMNCTSLCNTESDCRSGHFCDEEAGFCVRECVSDAMCGGVHTQGCEAWEYTASQLPGIKLAPDSIDAKRLGCGLGISE